MTTLAVPSVASSGFLPSLRSLLDGDRLIGHAIGIHKAQTCDVEEDEALPLLVSMSSNTAGATKQVNKTPIEGTKLPAIASLLATTLSSTEAPDLMTAQHFTRHNVVDQSLPSPASSPATASPSSSPVPFMSSSSSPWISSPPATDAVGADGAVATAASSLMALSDIIAKLPRQAEVDAGREKELECDASVSRRIISPTRRSKRQQQQVERVREQIEFERAKAHELREKLKLLLKERAELLQGQESDQASSLAFLNILNNELGSDLAFVDLPRANSLPGFSSDFANAERPSAVGRSLSEPMLPPITSIPALSPYLQRTRPALTTQFAPASCSVKMPFAPRVIFSEESNTARPIKRRRSADGDDEEDEDYAPNKKTKRSRSISEGGRRLQDRASQQSSALKDLRRKSQPQSTQEVAALASLGRRPRVNSESSRPMHLEQEPCLDSTSKRASVLSFMKDHPHASFWLSKRD